MNQILYTAEGKPSGPLPIETIVKFFAYSLITLGVIFFGEGTYAIFAPQFIDNAELDTSVPEISFARDGNNAIISVTHNKGIARVKYNWNDNAEEIVRGDSQSEIVISDLVLPSGVNTLHVTATDDNGRSATKDFEYTYDGIAIDLLIGNPDVEIIASDVTGMSYMTYKWNSEPEVKAFPNEEGDTVIKHTTEIPSGKNTLYITAVNSSNIKINKKQDIKGNKRPEIEFYLMDMTLYVTVRDEEGVDTVTQQVNLGQEETFQANGEKEYSYKYYVGEEDILVTITAVDVEGVSKTLKGKNY